jgi:hypothetical protein
VTATLTADSTDTTTIGVYAVKVTGKYGSTISQTTTVNVTVNSAVAATFTLAASAASPATVAPGGTSVSNITVNTSQSNPYTGTVTLTCAKTSGPTNASSDEPLCDVQTAAVGVGSSTPVTVLTIAEVNTELTWPRLGGKGKGWTGAGGGAVLALLIFMGIPARRRSWRSMLGVLVLMALLGGMVACGGGGGGTKTTNPGSAAGTYVYTVTGTGNPAVSPAPATTFTVVIN